MVSERSGLVEGTDRHLLEQALKAGCDQTARTIAEYMPQPRAVSVLCDHLDEPVKFEAAAVLCELKPSSKTVQKLNEQRADEQPVFASESFDAVERELFQAWLQACNAERGDLAQSLIKRMHPLSNEHIMNGILAELEDSRLSLSPFLEKAHEFKAVLQNGPMPEQSLRNRFARQITKSGKRSAFDEYVTMLMEQNYEETAHSVFGLQTVSESTRDLMRAILEWGEEHNALNRSLLGKLLAQHFDSRQKGDHKADPRVISLLYDFGTELIRAVDLLDKDIESTLTTQVTKTLVKCNDLTEEECKKLLWAITNPLSTVRAYKLFEQGIIPRTLEAFQDLARRILSNYRRPESISIQSFSALLDQWKKSGLGYFGRS